MSTNYTGLYMAGFDAFREQKEYHRYDVTPLSARSDEQLKNEILHGNMTYEKIEELKAQGVLTESQLVLIEGLGEFIGGVKNAASNAFQGMAQNYKAGASKVRQQNAIKAVNQALAQLLKVADVLPTVFPNDQNINDLVKYLAQWGTNLNTAASSRLNAPQQPAQQPAQQQPQQPAPTQPARPKPAGNPARPLNRPPRNPGLN